MLTKMIETLKKNPRTIVYTEGTDKRILESAHRLTQEGILGVVLLGKPEEVKAAAKAGILMPARLLTLKITRELMLW